MPMKDLFTPIKWLPEGKVCFLEQTRLPREEVWVETSDCARIADAIERLAIRGAPLIGIAAAYGLALAALSTQATDYESFRSDLLKSAVRLRSTRPTAVNLGWALDRVMRAVDGVRDVSDAREVTIRTAQAIHQDDIGACRRIGEYGAPLLPAGARVMTHCNAGALATGGYGTALGVIRSAWKAGRLKHVLANETRPLLQGARLTAWELREEGIPFTLIPDSAAGLMMQRGKVDAVVTGADRIAANGDTANKVGTYHLAVLSQANRIPFYIAAPTSTVDLSIASGAGIPIEERSPSEVREVHGVPVAPDGVDAANPAFDVTPGEYIAAIVTEAGVGRAPYGESLRSLCQRGVAAHA